MKTKVISFINLKGGVAKTTTTIGTAECLAAQGHKVLVIDLDPQTNATIMLIGDKRWVGLNRSGYTLDTLFEDACKGTHTFNLKKSLQIASLCAKEAGDRVSLLPSSLELIAKQDELAQQMAGPFGTKDPTKILQNALAPVIEDYDYILIDCPPSLNKITLNGLRMSNGYVIPTIPDILSPYGIPQVIERVKAFSRNIEVNIPCLGILPTKVKASSLYKDQLALLSLKEMELAPLFNARFKDRSQVATAAGAGPGNTLKQKWGSEMAEEFGSFVLELKKRLG